MAIDLSAIAKWPNVPACYDWLSLDQRGNWRLQGERVSHSGLIDFLNRHYGADETGCWFVQNGPQRVFVRLAATPWIFRLSAADGDDALRSHTGQPAGAIKALYLDAEGKLLFDTALGIGLLDDRDLATCLDQCRSADGQPADEAAFAALMAGQPRHLTWFGRPLLHLCTDVATTFRFNPQPAAA